MNRNLILQSIKIKYYPLYSMQIYKNPELLNNKDFLKKESQWTKLYKKVTHGQYMTRYDWVKQQAKKHWYMDEIMACDPEDICINMIEEVAKNYLYVKNGRMHVNSMLKGDEKVRRINGAYDKYHRWHMFKNIISEDLVMAKFLVDRKLTEPKYMKLWSASINSGEGDLNKILGKGLAELHMHLGAAKHFGEIWADCMKLERKGANHITYQEILVDTDEGWFDLSGYIQVAAIVRGFLGYYLKLVEEQCSGYNTIDDLINRNKEDEALARSMSLIDRFYNGDEINRINKAEFENVSSELYDYYQWSHYEGDCDLDYREELKEGDPLVGIFEIEKPKLGNLFLEELPERLFLIKSLDYMRNIQEKDRVFKRLFFQYIRIKNIYYQKITQIYTAGKGLDIFGDNYYKNLGKTSQNFLLSRFLNNQCYKQKMKKLEVRTVIGNDDELGIRKYLKSLMIEYLSYLIKKPIKEPVFGTISLEGEIGIKENLENFVNPVLLGFTISFNKAQRVTEELCRYSHYLQQKGSIADDEKEDIYLRIAGTIAKLRAEIKGLDKYIVGIDTASKELESEPYYFKKAYEKLRSYNDTELFDDGEISHKNLIGYTYHVGEEFRDIVSGLRHIDEVVEHLEFRHGDRLGHAVVLGIDIDKWTDVNDVVVLNHCDYLFNLLWEWGLYTKDSELRDIENLVYIENQIKQTAEAILGFSDGVSVDGLYRVYQDFYDKKIDLDEYIESFVAEKIFNSCANESNAKEKTCDLCPLQKFTREKYNRKMGNYTSNSNVNWNEVVIKLSRYCKFFACQNKSVEIYIDNKMKTKYKTLQKYMQKKLEKMGIVIELNPSSNLTICDFEKFSDYHVLNLSNPKEENMIVTINTDDPAVFNTTLENEYSIIFDMAMKTEKYSRIEVLRWIDKLRENAMTYSFIEDRGKNALQIAEEVVDIINAL